MVEGAEAVIVNVGTSLASLALLAGMSAMLKVQVNVAPADEAVGSTWVPSVQLIELTPEPAVTAVATTPEGNTSLTVAVVPEAPSPELPKMKV